MRSALWGLASFVVVLAMWMVQRDVEDGDDAGETVREGEMPPFPYPLTHPGARLTDAEKATFAAGLDATFGGEDDD